MNGEQRDHSAAKDNGPMELSVIIPTYQRPQSLLRALGSLQKQVVPKWEILIVDNEASRDTERLVAKNRAAFNSPVKYIAEPRLGLHYARHAGVRAAQGQVLVFTDDDATFDSHWLEAYAKAFAHHPRMAAAGGAIKPKWEAEPPTWLRAYLRDKTVFPILSLLDSADEFTLGPQGFFFGANMAVRRSVLFEVGGFNPDSFGQDWLGDGETGLNYKLWQRGLLIGYVPEAVVYHHIPSERMTLDYFRRRMANEGACDIYTRFHQRMPGSMELRTLAALLMLRNSIMRVVEAPFTGRTDPWSLHIQLQTARWRAQLRYIFRLLRDHEFREFVLTEDWLNAPCSLR